MATPAARSEMARTSCGTRQTPLTSVVSRRSAKGFSSEWWGCVLIDASARLLERGMQAGRHDGRAANCRVARQFLQAERKNPADRCPKGLRVGGAGTEKKPRFHIQVADRRCQHILRIFS